jgi:hypothetical protein
VPHLNLVLCLIILLHYMTTIAIRFLLAYSLAVRRLSGFLKNIFRIRHVVVHCRGGLGNQLFQASSGYFVAKEMNTSLTINLNSVAYHNSENPVDISSLKILKGYSVHQNFRGWFYSRLILKFNWLFPSFGLDSLGRFPLGKFDRIFRIVKTLHLYGYFADFTFERKSKLFHGELEIADPSIWFNEMKEIISKEFVIAIHLRRGDFLDNPDHYGILGVDYYRKAMATIPRDLRAARLFVFSDDPLLARETLSQLTEYQFEFISPPSNSNALESLILFSLAKGQILANSTFGLWAAYISETSIFVCYPELDKNLRVMAEGLPDNWISIQGSWQ